MIFRSKRNPRDVRTRLRVEELEERIAPVIVDANNWVFGRELGDGSFIDFNAWGVDSDGNPEGGTSDWYTIFYVGPGQAEILADDGTADLTGHHIGNITITGATLASGLYIVETPLDDEPAIGANDLPWITDVGSLWVQGNIDVVGDIGVIHIDGMWDGLIATGVQTTMTVSGTLGKFDVGMMTGNILVNGDIHAIITDSIIGAVYDEISGSAVYLTTTPLVIQANGNIGSIIVGSGLVGHGEDEATFELLGGDIPTWVTIRANADELGNPGIIDLVRVHEGARIYDDQFPGGGDLGRWWTEDLPVIDPGPGGQLRFLQIDDRAFYLGPAPWSSLDLATILVSSDSSIAERTIVDDSGGVMIINPVDVSFTQNAAGEWEPTDDGFTIEDLDSDEFIDPETGESILTTGDSGGIPAWVSDGETITYFSWVEYLIVPLFRGGSVIARMGVHGSVDFSVTGNVEVSHLIIGFNSEYSEGLEFDLANILDEDDEPLEDIADLVVEGFDDVLDLTGFAHVTFSGSGETDIYYIEATAGSNTIVAQSTVSIPIIVNNTSDGDIISAEADVDIMCLKASNRGGGDVGASESITPYLLPTNIFYDDGDLLYVDGSDTPGLQVHTVESNIHRYNNIYGVFTPAGNIYAVGGGGAVGDVRSVTGTIRYVHADTNQSRDLGSPFVQPIQYGIIGLPGFENSWGTIDFMGRANNHVGDGVFGQIMVGTGAFARDNLANGLSGGSSFIGTVRLGEGLSSSVFSILDPVNFPGFGLLIDNTGAGRRQGYTISSGIFASGWINLVSVNQYGVDENGIYGDIMGGVMDPDTDITIALVRASGGAVIDGSGSYLGYSMIVAGEQDWHTDGPGLTGIIDNIHVSGKGAIITDTRIYAGEIHRIRTSGGTRGMVDSAIFTHGYEPGGIFVSGRLDMLSIDGPGIDNCLITVNGPGGAIRTTGPTGMITNTQIQVLNGLRRLDTWGLENSLIDITTLSSLSTLDHVYSTTFLAGGVRRMKITNDILNSTVQVAGPLDAFIVGGVMTNTNVRAVGPWGDLGRVVVTGDITGGEIYSEQSINLVQSKTGDINTDITAAGSGDLDADLVVNRSATIQRIIANKGDINGTIRAGYLTVDNADPTWHMNLTAKVNTIKAGGDINSDIYVGVINMTRDITGTASIIARLGTVQAGGAVNGDVTVGAIITNAGIEPGDMDGKLDIWAKLNKVKSGADIAGDVSVGWISAANDINGDVLIHSQIGTVDAGGNISGGIRSGVVDAGGNINGDINVPEKVSTIKAAGDLTGDVSVGTVDTPGTINGDLTFKAKLNNIKIDGDITGNIRVGDYDAGVAFTGAESGDGKAGSIKAGGAATGDVEIRGNLNSFMAVGDVGSDGGVFSVGGKLGKLYAGDKDTVGDLLSDVTIGGKLSKAMITGAFPGSLTVGGNTGTVQVIGDAGELGDAWVFGGKVTKIDIGDKDTDSDLVATVNIADKLSKLSVTGDIESDMDVISNVGRITAGRIFSDITIHGNLRFLSTGSGVQPGADPPDFDFFNVGFPTGSLTVDGTIGFIEI